MKVKGKNCSVHQRHSMILGKSRKIRTFTGLDTPRFNDVSGYRIFHAAEKVRFRKNTGPDTQCIRCVSGTRYLSILPFFSRIRVRIDQYRDHDTTHFTQCHIFWICLVRFWYFSTHPLLLAPFHLSLGSLRYGDYGLRLRINMPLRMIKTTWLFIFPA